MLTRNTDTIYWSSSILHPNRAGVVFRRYGLKNDGGVSKVSGLCWDDAGAFGYGGSDGEFFHNYTVNLFINVHHYTDSVRCGAGGDNFRYSHQQSGHYVQEIWKFNQR